MPTAPWFEAEPDRLERELQALIAHGVAPLVDAAARSQGILKVSFTIDGSNPAFNLAGLVESVQLEATYPDNYPYFRPEVFALNIALPRHQNPIGKNLCLLPRSAAHWEPRWKLATYLVSQLPKVLQKGNILDPAVLATDQDEQAEPASEFFAHSHAPVIFDEAGFEQTSVPTAPITILGRLQIGVPRKAGLLTRMAALETTDVAGVVRKLPKALWDVFPTQFSGHLVRLNQAPPFAHAGEGLNWLLELAKSQGLTTTFQSKAVPLAKGGMLRRVIGLQFPEEIAPGQMGMGWLFLIEGTIKETVMGPRGKPVEVAQSHCFYGKASRISPTDALLRVPAVHALHQRTIAVVGLGALGAPMALEFARNQVGKLRLSDYDHVEPGPTVRWPLGIATAGQLKAEAIHEFISAHYPATQVLPIYHKVGGLRGEGMPSEQEVMDTLLTDASLLIDASADKGVSHFLAETARARGIPFISVYATPGGWGGMVMRVAPGHTRGCWMCLQYHMDTGGTIPVPISDETAGTVQAPGCGDMTFTGASFDLQNVVLAAVRLAVSTLSSGVAGGYATTPWDVGVVQLMDADGSLVAPAWSTFPLEVHPLCPYCHCE
ncbi:ThiF family adenylyltransferase [Hymenobacter sp. J193]|uniref:ThiF family adenylyltransferase n=2 Tax=Hymenobacter sp. J193 TaxID=2898429 RepID=UPI0021517BBC|nr:ThiF family adenylyltransferase [Hymenobacter sp. J193]MCR5890724.1 ThiF family adenylyltransferase [Hymenobacter sp. J193]